MPTEAELRTWLHDAGDRMPEAGAFRIDSSAVIRRSKRRRLPKQLAVGGTLTLAVAGVGIGGVISLQSTGSGGATMSAADTSQSESLNPESVNEGSPDAAESGGMPADDSISSGGIQQAPANKINLCGGELAQVAPSATGLVLTPAFPAAAPVDSATVEGAVVLTNTGTARVTGTTAASPAITLSQDGIVLWHSNGPMIMIAVMVDLAPGESMEYPASFMPVRCEVEDDLAQSFRDDLPALPTGSYEVSAAIDLIPDVVPTVMPPAPPLLITGPATSVLLD